MSAINAKIFASSCSPSSAHSSCRSSTSEQSSSAAASPSGQHLPRKCERIAQGVAKLSAFRIPPCHLKRCSEGTLPFTERLVNPQPRIVINGVNGHAIEAHKGKTSHRPTQRLSSSSNSLLRVHPDNVMSGAGAGKRLMSLDSCAPMASNRMDWLATQQMLVAEAAQLDRRHKKAWCNGVGASYAFLALSVLLSLSVVIGVCLFLHSFVPKEYYKRGIGTKMSRANRMDAGILPREEPKKATSSNAAGAGLSANANFKQHKKLATFADEPIPFVEYPMFYKRRRK